MSAPIERNRASVEDDTPIVRIRMTESAAERLAKACSWAEATIRDAMYEDARKPTLAEADRLDHLSWASRWLTFEGARR